MVKIAFHTIVFNGATIMPEGMLKACIENVYPFASQVLIAEGAVKPTAKNPGDATWASKDGHSTDNTVEVLKSIPDLENKIDIISNPNGFWEGKLEMVNALSQKTADDIDYVFQLDADEFYKREDLKKIIRTLDVFKPDQMHFRANFFWGDFNHIIEPGAGWANSIPWMRIFKHSPKARWLSHAPPLYSSAQGPNILTREKTQAMGLRLYHYAYVARGQAEFKKSYYANSSVDYVSLWDKWQENHEISLIHGDKTIPFKGVHPKVIQNLLK